MKCWLILLLFILLAGCASAPHDDAGKLADGRAIVPPAEANGGFAGALSVSQASAPAAPVIETPTQSSLNGRYPLLSGTGAPGATVQVMQSSQINRVVVSTVVGANGRWAARSALELAPGSFSMAGRQTLGGQTSAWGLTRVFTVVDAPVAPVIENPLQSSQSGRYPLLSGTGIPGATVQVMQSSQINKVLVSTTVDAHRQWTGRSALELAPGSFSMAGRQTLDGKTSAWGLTRVFTVVDAPTAPVIASPLQGSLNGRYPLLSGTGIPGATVQVMQSGQINNVLVSATVDAQGQWTGRSALELAPGPFSMAGRQLLDGKTSAWGLTRVFTVVAGPSVFKVVEATAGELNAETLGANATVQVSYPTLAPRDTVGVRLSGVELRDAPIQTVSTVGVLTFYLPKAWITKNLNRTVSLTYTYKVGGAGSLITSSPLAIKIVGAAAEGDGQRVANELNQQYADTRQNCGSASLPAVLCSGVILRATINGTGYRAWNPSPLSQKNGGVSFFYIRKDAAFKAFPAVYPNTSGIIFYPPQSRPQGMVDVPILCIFPMDGGSDIRGDQGCGVSSNYPSVSRSCELQGITTAAGWLTHYNQGAGAQKYQRQCGFNVRTSQGQLAANAFYQGILAMKLLGAESFNTWNEIRLATWPQNIHTTLPIKAFFYTRNGLANARFNQQDFYKYSSKAVPVIKLTLPSTTTESARFEFIKADQVVGNWR